MSKSLLFVISGPSGVGKGELLKRLVERNKDKVAYSISATTRECRIGETEGVTYFYKTEDEFDQLIKEGDVLEFDIYNDHRYGTLKSVLADAVDKEKNLAFDITVPGAVAVKEIFPDDAVTVFILPPSIEELERRLIGRGRDSREEIDRRLKFAIEHEICRFNEFDYVVTNDDLDETVMRLEHIMDTAFAAAKRNPDVLKNLNVENYLN